MKKEFFVTLPSNSSERYYPEKTSHFTTKIHPPLVLSKNCKVGLSEVIKPRKINNLRKSKLKIVKFWKARNEDDRQALSTYDTKLKELLEGKLIYEYFEIDGGFFENIDSVITHLNKTFEKYYEDQRKHTLTFGDDTITAESYAMIQFSKKDNNQIQLSRSNQWFQITLDGEKIPMVLKCYPVFTNTSFQNIIDYTANDVNTALKKHDYYWFKYKDLDKLENILFVNTDIIEEQYFGDMLVKCLRAFPGTIAPSGYIHTPFNPPYFLNPSRRHISDIEILLTDQFGPQIEFEGGTVQVVLRIVEQ